MSHDFVGRPTGTHQARRSRTPIFQVHDSGNDRSEERITLDAITIRGLHKRYGDATALAALDLRVREGEVHGLIGPNGAGKSTTIRILLGLLRADSGSARVLGLDPWSQATSLHRCLAYVPSDVALWPNLTGGEAIDLLGSLRGGVRRTRRDQLIERFQLDPTRKGHTYSTGNRQKVALVAALSADVRLLLLDEPTRGLDPLMTCAFQEVLAERKQEGQTVLLSSHILSDVEEVADSVTMLRAGRAVSSDSLQRLRSLARTEVRMDLRTAPTQRQLATLDGPQNVALSELPGSGPAHCRLTFTAAPDQVGHLVTALNPNGITAMVCTPPSLEELFLEQFRSAP
ncbi:ABC transporter ATP-binding protein [Flexivirga endophytica]|uniref:ABC transporter ATP-binding protein n=1 Tax=Flexivirga endophytica TaxID=1849103 RepID=A0A916WU99_9MICO|nr:ABC transporter ATP-binding protein [Flexivirga endophytica]GGB34714.1 ABC transporter ATP-binding protein [Flexivirga endophytica]GHB42632.1 ABC transporter ATP-binding protein [Flexivirga endophytica]